MHHAFSKLFVVARHLVKGGERRESGPWEMENGKWLLGSRLQNAFIRKFMYLTGDDDADEQNDDADVKGHRRCGEVETRTQVRRIASRIESTGCGCPKKRRKPLRKAESGWAGVFLGA